jgi:hypothetical protein
VSPTTSAPWLDPERQIVRLHPREHLDATRELVAGGEHLRLV